MYLTLLTNDEEMTCESFSATNRRLFSERKTGGYVKLKQSISN